MIIWFVLAAMNCALCVREWVETIAGFFPLLRSTILLLLAITMSHFDLIFVSSHWVTTITYGISSVPQYSCIVLHVSCDTDTYKRRCSPRPCGLSKVYSVLLLLLSFHGFCELCWRQTHADFLCVCVRVCCPISWRRRRRWRTPFNVFTSLYSSVSLSISHKTMAKIITKKKKVYFIDNMMPMTRHDTTPIAPWHSLRRRTSTTHIVHTSQIQFASVDIFHKKRFIECTGGILYWTILFLFFPSIFCSWQILALFCRYWRGLRHSIWNTFPSLLAF